MLGDSFHQEITHDRGSTMDFHNKVILAPLTKGGNLPFRRLVVDFGADITVSEMAYSRFIVKGERRELALLRRHPSEQLFGVQLAAKEAAEAREAALRAVDQGASFIDINCGCPIHDTTRRGLGAEMLRKPRSLGRFVELLAPQLPVPLTIKVRIGINDGAINVRETARLIEEGGAAAITIHGRTKEQRYSKEADWNIIGEVARERSIPVIGNGDILTWYEAEARQEISSCTSVMIGRGALIKPWIFKEIKEKRSWEPSPEERIGVYRKLASYMKEHFRDDELGKKRAMEFLPWHLGFFCRYRPLPADTHLERSKLHPLIQTRSGEESSLSPLEAILRDPTPATHRAIAEVLWEAQSDEEAIDKISSITIESGEEAVISDDLMRG